MSRKPIEQIAQGNLDLSQRTEEQASALAQESKGAILP